MYCPLQDPAPLPSIFVERAPPPLKAARLEGDVAADVAIVGGGFSGLSTALHLAERGTRAIVLESREVGTGGSGRAYGQIVPYAKHDHRHILDHYGPDVGQRIVDAVAAGPEFVFSLVERLGISCDAIRNGLIFAAHCRSGAASLEERARYWQAKGAPVDLLDAAETERLVGSRYYPLSILDRRGGTLNPLAYVRGLAAAVRRAGVQIYERSHATAIERTESHWRLRTQRGSIAAKAVLVATGAYSDGLRPELQRSIIPMRAHQLVSRPLSDNVRRTILPGGQSLTDTRRLFSGVRVLPDGRFHLSADGPAFDPNGKVFMKKGSRRVRHVFPQIDEFEWETGWTGWVDMATDQYPHVHELAPGLWAIIGLSGRGIVFATLLGREMAERLLGNRNYEPFMPVTPVPKVRIRPFAAPLVSALMTLYRAIDRIELATYIRPGRSTVM